MMKSVRLARRLRLSWLSSEGAHPGLYLDRFLPVQEVKDANAFGAETPAWLREQGFSANASWPSRADFLKEVCSIEESPVYAPYFELYTRGIQALTVPEIIVCVFKNVMIQGRLVTGLGNVNVVENGIALHHTYGVPWLPGSGLKGLCARYCREVLGQERPECRHGGQLHDTIFGSTEAAGWVTFHDALPPAGRQAFLVPDVMTPHHSEYYGDGTVPPADYDSPTPVPFLSVRGALQLALSGPPGWTPAAFQILLEALENAGFGAKTTSGYGRIKS